MSLVKITKQYKNPETASEAFVYKEDLAKWQARNWNADETAEAPDGLIVIRKRYADSTFPTVACVTKEQLPKWERSFWVVPKEKAAAPQDAPTAPPAAPETENTGTDELVPPPEKPAKKSRNLFRKK